MKIILESKKMINNLWYIICKAFEVRKSIVGLCIACSVLTISINLLQLFFVPVILEKLETELPITIIIYISAFVILWMLLASAQTYINANTIFGRVELRSYFTFKIHDKMATTSFPNTEKKDFLEMMDRAYDAVSGNDGAIGDIWNILTQFLQCLFGLIVYVVLLTNVDGWLVGITVVTSICSYIFKIKANKWMYEHKEQEAELSRKIAYMNRVAHKLSIAKDIRLFNMNGWLKAIRKKDFEEYEDYLMEKENCFIEADFKKIFLKVLRNGFAYLYIIFLMMHNNLSISFFVLMINTVTGFESWIDGLLSSVTKLNEYSIQITYVRDFLSYSEIFKFEEGKSIKHSDNYDIKLKNVCYSYPDSDKECISNFNLEISFGEKLAIVGVNGAGKTTLVKLICGLIEPDSGEVLLNGNNIAEYNRKEYYQLFSCVFQNSSILAGTIACNIAQAFEEIDMNKIIYCSQKAGFYDKALELPDQFETKLGKEVYDEAVDLSGGEMQSLLLARALYKNGAILVLDEPTASLDPIAEERIYKKYDDISEGKTSIYISHRLASTKFCDKILMIDNGKIVEEGNHEELMAAKGRYYELYNTQSKYYKEG